MNDNVIYKVLPRGGGKTRWLVRKAVEVAESGLDVLLYTGRNPIIYRNFLETMHSETGKLVAVHTLESLTDFSNMNENTALFIDGLIESGISTSELNVTYSMVNKAYVTITGKDDHECRCKNKCKEEVVDPDQLTIFDECGGNS